MAAKKSKKPAKAKTNNKAKAAELVSKRAELAKDSLETVATEEGGFTAAALRDRLRAVAAATGAAVSRVFILGALLRVLLDDIHGETLSLRGGEEVKLDAYLIPVEVLASFSGGESFALENRTMASTLFGARDQDGCEIIQGLLSPAYAGGQYLLAEPGAYQKDLEEQVKVTLVDAASGDVEEVARMIARPDALALFGRLFSSAGERTAADGVNQKIRIRSPRASSRTTIRAVSASACIARTTRWIQ